MNPQLFSIWNRHKTPLTHSLLILLLFIICITLFPQYAVGKDSMPMRGDDGLPEGGSDFSYHAPNAYLLKKSLDGFNLPLWSPYTLGGMPLFAKPQIPVFQFTWLFLLLAPTAWLGLKWALLFHLFIAGVGMYLFMVFFMRTSPAISFLTSLLYMLNGNLLGEFASGHFNVMNAYAWLPFILLCLFLALQTAYWLAFSLGAGSFMALVILGGSVQEGMYVLILVAFVLFFHLFGKGIPKRILKAAIVGVIVFVVFFGLSAMKLLPMLELLDIAKTRAAGFSYGELVGDGTIRFATLIPSLLGFFGIIGLILLPFALFNLRKKKTILIGALMVFSLIILTKNPLIHLLWQHAPFISKMRGIYKVIFLFVFPLAVLMGLGASNLIALAREKLKSSFFQQPLFAHGSILILCAALIITLGVFGPEQPRFDSLGAQLEKNEILQFMQMDIAQDNELFRFKMAETNGIDWGTDFYSAPLGLHDIYGYDNVWNSNYMPIYLSAANSNPSKLFGMLNMKYLTSMNPLNISGFSFVQKFEECGYYEDSIDICQPRKSDGPYLYRNDLYLPRAYLADHAILVLGPSENTRNIEFFLLQSAQYDPATTVILGSESASSLGIPLSEFDSIILAGQPLQQDMESLRTYSAKGGALLPNIFAGENQLLEQMILSSLPKDDGLPLIEVPFRYLTDSSAAATLSTSGKFLVLSEQFSLYPGWNAQLDSMNIPLRTHATILTALYVDGKKGEITFVYNPSSVRLGILLSGFSLAIVLSLVVWQTFLYRKSMKEKSINS